MGSQYNCIENRVLVAVQDVKKYPSVDALGALFTVNAERQYQSFDGPGGSRFD
jgi:hypothetical protein